MLLFDLDVQSVSELSCDQISFLGKFFFVSSRVYFHSLFSHPECFMFRQWNLLKLVTFDPGEYFRKGQSYNFLLPFWGGGGGVCVGVGVSVDIK